LGPFLFILHCRRTAIAAVLRLPPYCDCRRTAIVENYIGWPNVTRR
jgi:hypothetical protein